ncbi:hypothetical protein QUF80_16695, partial [Desulfococcaceae bacterium HSG8]|nr:hypothetical protein [Desulfococcaceae bacterium HSG8]
GTHRITITGKASFALRGVYPDIISETDAGWVERSGTHRITITGKASFALRGVYPGIISETDAG